MAAARADTKPDKRTHVVTVIPVWTLVSADRYGATF
jgi:hypothetical protein